LSQLFYSVIQSLQNVLNSYFPGNTALNVLLFLGILIGGLMLRRVFSVLASRGVFRAVQDQAEGVSVHEFVALLRHPVEALYTLMVLFLAFDRLTIPPGWGFAGTETFGFRFLAERFFHILVIVATTWAVMRLVRFVALIFAYRASLTDSKTDDQLVPFFRNLGLGLVYIFAFFVFLGKVFAVDIAALVAGLGVGGLAVALAARETLENLLASFTIFAEKPFVAGDFIQINTLSGSVERIGFRSTRIRTADGSSIMVPNRLIVSQSLENQTERQFRRARYFVRLQLDTPSESIQAIIQDIQAALDEHPLTKTKPGTVWFDGFGEQSFDILVIYHVETPAFDVFNRVKERLNFRIAEIVQAHRSSFASPLTRIRVQADGTAGGESAPTSHSESVH
jgi:MscS family membrane protein